MAYKKTIRSKPSDDMMEEEQEFSFDENTKNKSTFNLGKIISILVIIVAIILAGWYLIDRYTAIDLPGGYSVNSNDWQAIFLSNGQVYFGKIQKINNNDLVLSDIYYLQVVTKPLQRTQEGEVISEQETQQELSLFKLGNELHGPKDKMVINRNQVLLTEELREDSQVVKAINDYLAQQ